MRRVFQAVVRGVLAVSIIAVLAVPAEARPVAKDRSFRDRLVKIVKVIISLGDGLSDPRP